jgi:hypothetical protein
LKPEDIKNLRQGDILRAPDGQTWNVDQVLSNGGVLVVQRKAVYDLSEWKPVDSYHITGGKEKPSK